MLMKVRIRENVYLPTEFKTDWCESPILKKELCNKYNLNLEACDFYNDKGMLVNGPEIEGELVTILQRPTGVTAAIVIGSIALVAAGGSLIYSAIQKNRAEEKTKNMKSLSNIYSYSLRGSTNDQRQYSPIPVVLGKVNVAGDKAGLQYSTYSNNFQDVHQLVCVGYSGKEYNSDNALVDVTAETGDQETPAIPVGGVVFEKANDYIKSATNPEGYIVRIADSPVDTFDNMYVDAQSGSNNDPTYYTERVIEVSQMSELQGNPDSSSNFSPIVQTSPKNTLKIRVGVYAPYGYYKTNDKAEKIAASYNYTIQYRKVGDSSWITHSSPSGKMKQSAYRRLIEIDLSSSYVSGADNQYQVRVFRNDYTTYYEWDSESQQYRLKDNSTCVTLSAEIIQFVTRSENLSGARVTKPIPYPGKYALLSMKARANDRTNGWMEKIFSEVHLKCRTYTGPMPDPQNPGAALPTCTPSMWTIPQDGDTAIGTMNNPASVLLYVLTCPQVNPLPVSYKDIDWESLRRWWLFCNDRQWTVNAFVTETMSVADLANLICAAGRARLVMSNNKFAVAIEDQTSIITQIFTPRNAWNMVQSKALEEPTTLLKCAFVNDETEVEENRYIHFKLNDNGKIDRTGGNVTILFDDAEEVLLEESNYKSESTDFWGVTNARQIGQLGAFQLYKGLCLNNKYTWECGLESLSCTIGDVVYLANDIFASSLGYGRIKDVKKENGQVVGVYIDEAIEIHEGQTYGLTIRTGAGEVAHKALFAVQTAGDDPQREENITLAINELNSSRNYLQFEQPLPANSDVTKGNLFIYNDAEQLGKKVIIESIQPNNDRGATITAVDYIPEMYTIDIDTEIPIYKSTINKYGTGANIAGGYSKWEEPNPSTPKTLIATIPQYYHSYSLNSLVPNVFVVTADTERQSGKTYYEENLGLSDRYVVSMDDPLIEGKTYYEDASWLDHIVERTGGIYHVNGHLVATDDTSPQIGKTYYYYDSEAEEYVIFEGSAFEEGVTYFEFEEYPSYVWHRQEFIYSNGTESFSTAAYYLTTADVANPFTLMSYFEVATSENWEITQDKVAIEGKTYYVNVNGRWEVLTLSVGAEFPVGATVYEIPNFEWVITQDTTPVEGKSYYRLYNGLYELIDVSGGSFPTGTTVYELILFGNWMLDAIPASWRSGLKVWLREILTYDNRPDDPIIQAPRYSRLHTQEMEDSCVFEVELNTYTWNKDNRSTQEDTPVTIEVNIRTVGYGNSLTNIDVTPPTSVTKTNASFTFPSNISADSLSVSVSLVDYPSVQPKTFTVKAVDITAAPAYLGILNAMPSAENTPYSVFLIGDHFVAKGITGKTDLMPYVLTENGWVIPVNGATYGGLSTNQILYNSVRDIFSNADWKYTACPTGATAQAGVNYFIEESEGVFSPIAVPVGESVEGCFIRERNVPSEVTNFYNYQESMLATYIGANDIELVNEEDKVGSVRSAGYAKGTVAEMNKTGTDEGFRKGFYLGGDGSFEAYKAELYSADMFEATVHGKLDAATFQTEIKDQTGTAVEDLPVNQGVKYWDIAQAVQTIRNISGWEDNKVKDLDTEYDGIQRSKAMYVSDPNSIVNTGTINGDTSYLLPIKAPVTIMQGKLFDANENEIQSGSIINRGLLINKGRWSIGDLFDNTSITENTIYYPACSYNGVTKGIVRLTNPNAYMFARIADHGACTEERIGSTDTLTYTVPNYIYNNLIHIGIYQKTIADESFNYFAMGAVEIRKNGVLMETAPKNNNPYDWSEAIHDYNINITAGDVLTFTFYPPDFIFSNSKTGFLGQYDVYFKHFSDIGMTTPGLYIFDVEPTQGSYVGISSYTNYGTDSIYFESDHSVNVYTPIQWNSADHLFPASFTYNYSQYSVGLNLLNAATSDKEALLTSGITDKVFSAAYGGTIYVDSNNAIGVDSLYKYRGLTQESGIVFAITNSRFSFTRGDGTTLPEVTNVAYVSWSSSSITVGLATGAVHTFGASITNNRADYLTAFDLYFVPIRRSKGNYSESIYPMKGESDRTVPIKLGLADNRFDEIHVIDVWGEKVHGAVWNDIADAIELDEDISLTPGCCYTKGKNGIRLASKYGQKGIIGVHSDTYGFLLGQKGVKKELNIAIGGFVLAYVDKVYPPGTPLTCTKDGKLTLMKPLMRLFHPERMVGTFYKIEDSKIWHNIVVDGRHWVKIH